MTARERARLAALERELRDVAQHLVIRPLASVRRVVAAAEAVRETLYPPRRGRKRAA